PRLSDEHPLAPPDGEHPDRLKTTHRLAEHRAAHPELTDQLILARETVARLQLPSRQKTLELLDDHIHERAAALYGFEHAFKPLDREGKRPSLNILRMM